MQNDLTNLATKWILDAAHSEILFKVKHLMISNVKGEFRDFSASIHTAGNDFSKASVNAEIIADSIFTNNPDRDTHLKSADFFDAIAFPTLAFKGTSFTKISNQTYALQGDLSIKGVVKSVLFDVDFGGISKDPWGNLKAGFSLVGSINRKDWGLVWNAALETGGVLVSDEVKIEAELQFSVAQ
jgi:polyisoprenoid-binding protein YceI